MNTIETTVRDGRINFPAPAEFPNGMRVRVEVVPTPFSSMNDDFRFMIEEEQSDDPAEIEKWIAELEALPGMTMTAEQEAEMNQWLQREREFNMEAARREIAEDTP